MVYRVRLYLGLASSVNFSFQQNVNKVFEDLPDVSDGKESACNVGDPGSIPGLGSFPWRREWQPSPVFLALSIPWTRGA